MRFRHPDTGQWISEKEWLALQEEMPDERDDFDDWDDFGDFDQFDEWEYEG